MKNKIVLSFRLAMTKIMIKHHISGRREKKMA